MDIKEVEKKDLNIKYEIFVEAKTLEKLKEKELDKLAKEVKIQGFRPGKAPKDLIEKQYGSKIIPEVVDKATNEAIDNLFKEKKLNAVSSPKVSLVSFTMESGLKLSIEVELFPEIKHLNFEDITLNKSIIEISEKDIEESLDKMADHYKSYKDITEDRATEKGDVAVIDFVGKLDGEIFEGGTGNDFPLELGSNSFIPGFEEQLIGKNKGDKIDVNVSFPENYHATHLAGKPVIFEVDIKKLQKATKSEINDELAKKSGFDTLEKLKDDIKSKYQGHSETLQRTELKKEVLEKLKETPDFEIPSSLIENEKKLLWDEFIKFKEHMKTHEEKGDFKEHNHSEEELALYKKSDEEVKKDHEKAAKDRLKVGLVLNDIAISNNLQVEQNDIMDILTKEAMMYGQPPQMLLDYYKNNPEAMKSIQNRALEEKIMDFILSKVKYNEKKISFEEFAK